MTLSLTNAMESLRTHSQVQWARLFKITRPDAIIHRFTDHNRILEFDENTGPLQSYTPADGPSTRSARKTINLSPADAALHGFVIASGTIDPDDILRGKWRDSTVDVYVVNWQYPWAGHLDYQRYWMHDITWSGEAWDVELRGIVGQLDVKIGRSYDKECDAQLGDSRCGINLDDAAWKSTSTVSSVVDQRREFQTGITGRADKFFKNGVLTWTSGSNTAEGIKTFTVKDYVETNGLITLWKGTSYDIQAGDAFAVTAGCDHKLLGDCKEKFNNAANFRGFPFMPTIKKILKTPNAQD